jgi:hypothetical protein
MSLQLAANHLAAQGRGPDSRLVHMSPREVAGLQALAMSQGGSLSINPQTGLPEAGFLDKMLPMLLGVGAMAMTGGAAAGIAPWMVGLGIGGLEAARTGNLGKGLMAGLGAYGGAGLAGGLLGAGAAGAAEAGLAGAAPQAATSAAGPAAFGLEEGLAQTAGAGMPQAATSADIAGMADVGNISGANPYIKPTLPPVDNAAILQRGRDLTTARMAEQGVTLGPNYTTSFAQPQDIFGGTQGEMARAYAPSEVATTTAMPTVPSAPAASMPQPYSNADYFSASDYGMSAPSPTPSAAGPAALDTELGTANAKLAPKTFGDRLSQMGKGIESLGTEQGRSAFLSGTEGGKKAAMYGAAAGLPLLVSEPKPLNVPTGGPNPYNFAFDPGREEDPEAEYTGAPTGERRYFKPKYRRLAGGGPVEEMSLSNVYDMQNARGGVSDMGIDNSTGMQRMARGGISHLGDYSDGGRLLRGPGDGVSDSIPAMIGNKQPARLADGEFVVPARIVSELGNGSTEAGARKLYAMMDRIQSARSKTTGKNKVAANTRSDKYLPA